MALGSTTQALEMLTMDPAFCWTMMGATRRTARTTFKKYMSRPKCHCASVNSSNGPLGPWPALLTSTSMRPQRAMVWSTSFCRSSLDWFEPVSPKPPNSRPNASPLPDEDNTAT